MKPYRMLAVLPVAVAALPCLVASAHAETLSLSGTVVNTCILNIGSPGVLRAASSGTMLSSEESGGAAATMSVSATGTSPTLSFTAPSLTTPAGAAGGSTTEMRYAASGGASQAWTSSASTAGARLIDTFTVHARITNSSGFADGTYVATTTVTCSQ